MPETSCMKGTSHLTKNMRIKQVCNRRVRDFAMALRARKVSRPSRNEPLIGKKNPEMQTS